MFNSELIIKTNFICGGGTNLVTQLKLNLQTANGSSSVERCPPAMHDLPLCEVLTCLPHESGELNECNYKAPSIISISVDP